MTAAALPNVDPADCAFNPAAEAGGAILSTMVFSPATVERASRILDPSDFPLEIQRKVFAAIVAITARGERADSLSVAAELHERGDVDRFGGYHAITRVLTEQAGVPENLEAHAEILRRSKKREHLRLVRAALSGPAILEHQVERRPSLLGDGVISAGDLVLMFGQAKLGKTWLALQLALAIASGREWFGLPTSGEPVNVGFLELELPLDVMQERLRVLGEIPPTFHLAARPEIRGVFDLVNVDGKAVHLAELRAWIRERDLRLVIIDALARATSLNQVDFSPLLLAFDVLRAETSCALGLIHHEGKPKGNGTDVDDLDTPRGDSRLAGFPQAILRVLRDRGALSVRFRVSCATTPEPFFYQLDDNGVPVPAVAPDQAAKARGSATRDRVLRAVVDAPRPVSCSEVAIAADLSEPQARKHLSALVDGAQIAAGGHGKNRRYSAYRSSARLDLRAEASSNEDRGL